MGRIVIDSGLAFKQPVSIGCMHKEQCMQLLPEEVKKIGNLLSDLQVMLKVQVSCR